VDRSCINCSSCRRIAPEIFQELRGQSVVYAQPKEAAAALRAGMALLACPVGAIGAPSRTDLRAARDTFPEPHGQNVLDVGYACRKAGGAASWLLLRPGGNVLVDVPRFAKPLLTKLEALGGVATLVITHGGAAGDHAAWAKHFGARRVMHAAEQAPSTRGVEVLIEEDLLLEDDLQVLATPGPSVGGCAVLWREEVLCSGLLLAGDAEGRLVPSRPPLDPARARASVERVCARSFRTVLPAHGLPWHGDSADLRARRLTPA
jgi:glyoxylase-like metal-dependent hydrolase (beta-lactamase superfamily II)